jgi:hypothetical protein
MVLFISFKDWSARFSRDHPRPSSVWNPPTQKEEILLFNFGLYLAEGALKFWIREQLGVSFSERPARRH